MPMTMFIQDHSGDYNRESEVVSADHFSATVRAIHENGGYYMKDNNDRIVFVPWHRIDFIRLEE